MGKIYRNPGLSEALERLRISKFPDVAKFVRKSGITKQAVEDVQGNKRVLRLDTIERWVRACDTTLGQFFSDMERDRQGEPAEIVIGFESDFELLRKIILHSDQGSIDAVRIVMEGLVTAAAMKDSSEAKPPPSLHRKHRRASS